MATVAGAGGERMMLRRRRLALCDLTNLSSSTSVLTRLKPAARPKPRTSPSAGSSTSSIGSSTAPHARFTAPPPPPPPPPSVAVIKGKDKSSRTTRELQSSSCHPRKIKKISKAKVKTGDVLPRASSPPSKKTRKVRREELLHMEPLDQSSVAVTKGKDKSTRELQSSSCHPRKIKKISKAKVNTGDVLPRASSPPSKKTRKVTREEQLHIEPLDQSSGEPLPSQDFIDERRAYFAEIDAFELVEEFASSGSDLE